MKTRWAELGVVGKVEKSRDEVKRVELRRGEIEQLSELLKRVAKIEKS